MAIRDHVQALGYLHIALGAMGVLGSLVVFVIFGGIAGIVGVAAHNDPDAGIAISILGLVGFLIAAFVFLLSIPGLIAGFGLLGFRPWARILTILLSVLHLLNVPVGTATGIYGLWVLLQPETERHFTHNYRVAPGA